EMFPEQRFTLCGGDDDYYRLAAGEGYKVTVAANFRRIPERGELMDDSARLDFAQIEIAVIGADGQVFAEDKGPEQPLERGDTPPSELVRALDTFVLPADAGDEGPVFLRIRGLDNAEAAYQVAIEVVPPCGKFEDVFEDNDDRTAAATLEAGVHDVRICPQDEDWYTFEAKAGDSMFMDLVGLPHEETGRVPTVEYELYAASIDRPIRKGTLDPNAENPLLNFEV